MRDEPKEVRYANVPSEEWIRYMAIFYRALAATERYAGARNIQGIWLIGWVLDALHNVPSLLRQYSETAWHNPKGIEEWLRHWSEFQSKPGYPDWMVTECHEIFSFDIAGNLQTLGLKDQTEIIRPPDAIAEMSLQRIYEWCIGFRYRIGFANFAEKMSVDEVREEHYVKGEAFAKSLLPLPLLLARWSEQEWKEYQQKIQTPPAELPSEYVESWQNFFTKLREDPKTPPPVS